MIDESRAKVLIVDDTALNVKILSRILKADHEILTANDGYSALETANQELPDLILLDVIMPDMDGYTVCEKLKASHKTRDIPVIFVTSMDEVKDETRAFEVGAVDYLTKPVIKPIVLARVKTHLELKRHRDLLERISTLDGLTSIANRRRFETVYDQEWRRALRSGKPISIVIMDVDNFKRYNDTYGHLAGDDCLKSLAQTLESSAKRPMDLVARFGGEEFIALLPETDSQGACLVAEFMRKNIQELGIKHKKNDHFGIVTISLGVATTLPLHGDDPRDLKKKADDALYQAKKHGRNRYTSVELTEK